MNNEQTTQELVYDLVKQYVAEQKGKIAFKWLVALCVNNILWLVFYLLR
jgi:Mn-containing catalase